MATKKKEEIVVAPKTQIEAYDYGDEEGAGYEHQTSDDTQIPFMVLLQPMSPSVVDGKEGAKPGCWYNTVTEEIYPKDEGFLFVPATTRHYYGEWTPRDAGGGFHGHHEVDSELVQEAVRNSTKFGRNKLDNGNDLVECYYAYGVVCDGEEPESMAVIAFTSTKIRSYKGWQTRMRQLSIQAPSGRRMRPPMNAHLTRVTSEMKKNDQGTFYVPVINSANPAGLLESLLPPSDARFQAAKECRTLVDGGEATINPDQQNAQNTTDAAPF